MLIPSPDTPVERAATRGTRRALVVAGVAAAVVLAALIAASVHAAADAAIRPALPYTPSEEDGLIPAGSAVGMADTGRPAIARLDPALRDAFRAAEVDAATEGIVFEVTSGWRSDAYQRWLYQDAIERYGSEDAARQFVATPERSSHVTGEAVDVGPLDAQFWLIEHGSDYGLCQTYANERWHFQRATEPGGDCPDMRQDAAS